MTGDWYIEVAEREGGEDHDREDEYYWSTEGAEYLALGGGGPVDDSPLSPEDAPW